jgi:large subunit ribosomal protein L17
MAEKMLTLGRSGSLHARRPGSAILTEPAVVRKVFGDLAEKYRGKQGGYTRLVKLGARKGDASEMALLELV